MIILRNKTFGKKDKNTEDRIRSRVATGIAGGAIGAGIGRYLLRIPSAISNWKSTSRKEIDSRNGGNKEFSSILKNFIDSHKSSCKELDELYKIYTNKSLLSLMSKVDAEDTGISVLMEDVYNISSNLVRLFILDLDGCYEIGYNLKTNSLVLLENDRLSDIKFSKKNLIDLFKYNYKESASDKNTIKYTDQLISLINNSKL